MIERKPLLIGLALIVAVIVSTAGYALGHGQAPTDAEAASARNEAFSVSFRSSSLEAFTTSREKGEQLGLKRGFRAGTHAGRRKGSAAGNVDSGEELARIAAEEEAAQLAAEQAAADAEAARQIAEYGSTIPGNIPADAPSTCPPGYHFENPASDACVPD